MFRRFSTNFAVLSIFLDLILVGAALVLSAELRSSLNFLPFVQKVPPVELPGILYVVFPLLWVSVLFLFSVYDGRKNLRYISEFTSLMMGSLLATISLAGVLYLSYRDVSRFLFVLAGVLAFLLILLWRGIVRLVFKRQGLHRNIRRVLILGAGSVGRQVGDQINRQPQLGLVLVGYLDDDKPPELARSAVLGPLAAVRSVALSENIDDIIIAFPLDAHERMSELVCDMHDLPVHVWVIPDYFALVLHRARTEEVAGIPMLDLRAPALSEYQRMVKRGFDIAVSLFFVPFMLPVMAIVALVIWLYDHGPIFYCTIRAGENGRAFKMFKFRTMTVDADKILHQVMHLDKNGNVIHKTADDPRVTRVGRFLRRASLDELPQIINVLKGDMSLVGPRPEMPEMVGRYDFWQRERFAVPQGMTGWWQVNGRSDKPMHLNTDKDLYYVQNYSIWLDLQILFRTVLVVFRGKGAY